MKKPNMRAVKITNATKDAANARKIANRASKAAYAKTMSEAGFKSAQAAEVRQRGALKLKRQRSLGRNTRTIARTMAGEETARHYEDAKTQRHIASQQASTAKAALEKWNGIINQTPTAADGTGSGSQGSNPIQWVGNL